MVCTLQKRHADTNSVHMHFDSQIGCVENKGTTVCVENHYAFKYSMRCNSKVNNLRPTFHSLCFQRILFSIATHPNINGVRIAKKHADTNSVHTHFDSQIGCVENKGTTVCIENHYALKYSMRCDSKVNNLRPTFHSLCFQRILFSIARHPNINGVRIALRLSNNMR